jgi:hypothetical protein
MRTDSCYSRASLPLATTSRIAPGSPNIVAQSASRPIRAIPAATAVNPTMSQAAANLLRSNKLVLCGARHGFAALAWLRRARDSAKKIEGENGVTCPGHAGSFARAVPCWEKLGPLPERARSKCGGFLGYAATVRPDGHESEIPEQGLICNCILIRHN